MMACATNFNRYLLQTRFAEPPMIRLFAFLGILTGLVACAGSGRDIIRAAPVEQTYDSSPHPLSTLLGLKGVAESFRCSSADAQPGPYGACNGIGAPFFSLSLSGGGYRATLFHYGAIKYLNDSGRLKNLRMICGVSGGSIAGAALAIRWHNLDFDHKGIAENLEIQVGTPLLELTARTIDAPVVLSNLASSGLAGKTVSPALNQSPLFRDLTLRDLPNDPSTPFLVIEATDIRRGQIFLMSRNFIGHDFDQLPQHTLRLSQALAASSAFPPVLGPIRLEAEPIQGKEAAFGRIYLVDGGVVDNLGFAYCSRAQIQYVSDASNPIETNFDDSNWAATTSRVVDLIHSLDSKRFRDSTCFRDGRVCWGLTDAFGVPGQTDEETLKMAADAQVPTRFKGLRREVQCALMNTGYFSAANAFRDQNVELHAPCQTHASQENVPEAENL